MTPHKNSASDLDLPASPDQRTGFLIRMAHQLTRKGFNEALRPLGIEARHLGVLTVIDAHGPLSQARFVELLGLDKSVVVVVVDDLERLGLARRQPHPSDRRAYAVEITAEGRKRVKTAKRIAERFGRTVFAGMSRGDRRRLDDLLRRIITNCQDQLPSNETGG